MTALLESYRQAQTKISSQGSELSLLRQEVAALRSQLESVADVDVWAELHALRSRVAAYELIDRQVLELTALIPTDGGVQQ